MCRKKASKYPSFRLWTFPVLVDGPFGVVSAAELIGILLFVVFVIWAVYAYIMSILSLMSDQLTFKEKRYHVCSRSVSFESSASASAFKLLS